MVLQDSPPNPASSIPCQNQNQFENQHFDAYDDESGLRGVLPSIYSLREKLVHTSTAGEESEMSYSTMHLMDLLGAPNENNNQAKRLSLSLGSCVLVPQVQCRQRTLKSDLISPIYMLPAGEEACNQQQQQQQCVSDGFSFNGSTYRWYELGETFSNVFGNSRYLKPTQALLEQTVNVCVRGIDITSERKLRRGSLQGVSAELKAELCSNGVILAEKHGLQVKIAKLISLLGEVEERYYKYYHEMEKVVSSFEVVAGLGSANTYTGMALQAMSRHFCNLRDSILSQIHLTKREFSQDLPNKINSGLSQLSLLDGKNRHSQISLQQLAMIQSQRQTWRPVKGLPDTSVSILRSWLFEHFLHPYPSDSEKVMLSSQTGLTKNQVSNWFINARVRLWKPMIEEMYEEEFGDSSEDSGQMTRGDGDL